jgi:hypothetical protein
VDPVDQPEVELFAGITDTQWSVELLVLGQVCPGIFGFIDMRIRINDGHQVGLLAVG